MPEPLSDIDSVLLAEAGRLLGSPGDTETVNQALAALIRERRRESAVEAEIHRLAAGRYTGLARGGRR